MFDGTKALIVIAALLASGPLFGRSARASDIPQKIDSEEAVDLVYEAVKKHSPKSSLEYGGQSEEEGLFFKMQGLGPESGSYGIFAVNPWTGDIWNIWGCERLSTPGVRKLQAKIRQRFTKDELKKYPKLRKIRPACISD